MHGREKVMRGAAIEEGNVSSYANNSALDGESKDANGDNRVNGLKPDHVITTEPAYRPVEKVTWEPETINEEPESNYATSCGCPLDWKARGWRGIPKWVADNQVDLLAGLTTGLTAVPTAVAFAILAEVQPAVGLRGTWIIMLIMATFGGRTGMIYSNSGSMGVVLQPLVEDHGVEYLFYAFILAGLIQIGLGLGGIHKVLRLMPVSVMIGFVNGLAIVLFLAQVKNFQRGITLGGPSGASGNEERRRRLNSFDVFYAGSPDWITGSELGYMLVIAAFTMITIVGYPKLVERMPHSMRMFRYLPPILVGIIVATVVEWAFIRGAFGSETRTLKDIAKISGELPNLIWQDNDFNMPPFNGDTFGKVLPTAISLMAVGLVESLMTVRLVNEITQSHSNVYREAIMGGVGNFFAGVFGGQGGNSEIGLTMVNLESGGRKRVAGVVAGLLVLIVILAAYSLINLIPMAGFVGMMVVIAFNTFDWSSTYKILSACMSKSKRGTHLSSRSKIPRPDALIIIVVTVVTPFTNLAIAVGCGIALAVLCYTWNSGNIIHTRSFYRSGIQDSDPPVIRVYEITGPLFFASTDLFLDEFDHRNDPDLVELHFHTGDISDYSAMQALNTLGERYTNVGKKLRLRRIKTESLKVIDNARDLLSEEIMVEMDEIALPTSPAARLNVEHQLGQFRRGSSHLDAKADRVVPSPQAVPSPHMLPIHVPPPPPPPAPATAPESPQNRE